MYGNLDSFIKGEQDPSISYFLIRQNFQNMENGINISIPEDKNDKVEIMLKLDIFKGVMQYIEEFGIYFLAYLDGSEPISDKIIRIRPQDVKTVFQNFNDEKHDDFAKDKGYSSYEELLVGLFKIPPKKSADDVDFEETISNLKKAIDKLAWFYIFYSDLYNAIKHGFRVFKGEYGKIEIHDENETILSIELNEEYFDAVCKEEVGGRKYILMYPASALLENSMRVLEDVHEAFNYLRKTNNYQTTVYFTYEVLNNFLVYMRSYNDDHVIYLPYSEEFINKHAKNPEINHARILVRNKTIEFHLCDEESIECPFTIKWGDDYGHHPKPGIKSDLKISSNLYMDVEQYYNLIQVENLAKNYPDEIIVKFKDENRKEILKLRYGDMNFPKLPGRCDEATIKCLSIIKRITHTEIPVPLDLSKKQKEIINSNIDCKFSRQEDAVNLLDELKKHNINLASFCIILVDSEGKEISKNNIGSSFNMDLLGADLVEKSSPKHFNIVDLADKGNFKDISIKNIGDFIKYLEASLKSVSKKEDLEIKYDNKFGLLINVKLKKEFWYNEYVVNITLQKAE